MRLKAGWLAAGSLLAFALAAGATSASGQTSSPGATGIVLPALPDAPVVIGKPAAAPPAAKGSGADASPQPAPVVAPENNSAAAAPPKNPVSAETPMPAAIAKAPDSKAPDSKAPSLQTLAPEAPAVPQTSATAPEATAPPEPPLKAALDIFTTTDVAKGRAAIALRKQREAIASFYAGRQYAPLWLDHQDWTPGARAVLARLKAAADEGLDPARLHIPTLGSGDAPSKLAAELALTEAVVVYGEAASGGQINPRAISPLIDGQPQRFGPAEILQRVTGNSDPSAALENFNPPQAGYRALRAKLAELHAARSAAATPVPSGPTLHVGMSDARVPLVRARFGLNAPQAGSDVYDARVAAAVASFQRSVGLPASGRLTPRTAALLSGRSTTTLEADLIVNMEFWRWLPRDMGTNRIEVNIPDYSLALYHDDEVVHRARVIVGKPGTQTPLFSNEVRFIIVNPSWNVPQSIVKKEMLPKLATDPDYFQRMGYVVTRKGAETRVRQPPGPRNALGQIKFMFPNNDAVYLHDTPERSLFRSSSRAFSHGCVRVQDPFALAELVLGRDRGWSEARLKKMVGLQEHTVRLPQPLPIHLEYFTASVDSDGRVQVSNDVYGYAKKVEAALGLHA